MTVTGFTDHEIYGQGLVVADSELPRKWLFEGAQLNLLLTETDDNGHLRPQHIILEPDYLVDVTAICRCATECGDAPAHHLLQKFLPHTATDAIQLGAVANQFLDDIVNSADSSPALLFRHSLRKSFTADPLRFSTVAGIDASFSEKCKQQFQNIRQTMAANPIAHAQLETAFQCEALGIQGRMDLMSEDMHTIIELKSGRGGFSRQPDEIAYRYEHALQMALYKESLYYNASLPYAQVRTLLFYSLYPALMDIHLGRKDIHRAIMLRNGIVDLERRLCTSPEDVLMHLKLNDFNPAGRQDRFFQNYQLPPIQRLIGTIRSADALLRQYFFAMLAFVQREQLLAKTAAEHEVLVVIPAISESEKDSETVDDSVGSPHPPLSRLHFRFDPSAESDFRPGDLVMLHTDTFSSAFYFPCIIEDIGAGVLDLRLRYPQRDASIINSARRYAIETAHVDSTYATLYQGLFALLEAPRQRQDLILGQRQPRTNPSLQLAVPVADAALRDIILRAKQAEDYFLLVGPPGTGKTSVALRQMVIEFLASNHNEERSLLLMAFTNRAVDEICQMLTTITPQPEYLRIGPELSTSPAFRERTLTALARRHPTREAIRRQLAATPIVVGTIASLASSQELFLLKTFDTAIIDEASQVLEPQLLPLLAAQVSGKPAIRKFIFIGDHKQLPAVVVQPTEASLVCDTELHAMGLTDCRRSLFERLHTLALHQGSTDIIAMLRRQGRMHRDIGAFASRQYYGGQLDILPLPHQTGELGWKVGAEDSPLHIALATHRLLCFDICNPEESGQKSNSLEARQTAQIVASFADLCCHNALAPNWEKRLGIIVPFRSQIQQLRNALTQLNVPEADTITIDTVERYQGSQRDIIIFSTVVGAPWQLPILSDPVDTEGELVDRKLNVAITRARQQFILVGNLSLLDTCKPYHDLIHYILSQQ
jgi:hypothetical protein